MGIMGFFLAGAIIQAQAGRLADYLAQKRPVFRGCWIPTQKEDDGPAFIAPFCGELTVFPPEKDPGLWCERLEIAIQPGIVSFLEARISSSVWSWAAASGAGLALIGRPAL